MASPGKNPPSLRTATPSPETGIDVKKESVVQIPIYVTEKDVVQKWRSAAEFEGMDTDADMARCLLNVFFASRRNAASCGPCSRCNGSLVLACANCKHPIVSYEKSSSASQTFSSTVTEINADLLHSTSRNSPSGQEEGTENTEQSESPCHYEDSATDAEHCSTEDQSEVVLSDEFQRELESLIVRVTNPSEKQSDSNSKTSAKRKKKSVSEIKEKVREKLDSMTLRQKLDYAKKKAAVRYGLSKEILESVSGPALGLRPPKKKKRKTKPSAKVCENVKKPEESSNALSISSTMNKSNNLPQQRKKRKGMTSGYNKNTKKYRNVLRRLEVEDRAKVYTVEDFMTGKVQIPIGKRDPATLMFLNFSHYTCPWCCKVFEERDAYECHMKIPHADADLENQSPDPDSVEILKNIKERLLKCCPRCNRVFFSYVWLRDHELSHDYPTDNSGVTIYPCEHCKRVFSAFSYLDNHLSHPMGFGNCEKCGLKFGCFASRRTHMSEHNKGKICNTCGIRWSSLSKEKRKEHLQVHPKTETTCELCPHCGKGFKKASSLKLHVQDFHSPGGKQHACDQCSATFYRAKSLEKHKEKHGEKKKQCELCGMRFHTEVQMKYHRQMTHGDGKLSCPHCPREFCGKNSLKGHIERVHEGKVKSYQCQYCDKAYNYQTTLDHHVLLCHVPDESKLKKCPFCPKKLPGKSLRIHIQSHSKQKQYSCEDCSQEYTSRNSLKVHREKHHPHSLYSCSVCGQSFALKGSFHYHQLQQHGISLPPDYQSRDTDQTRDSSNFFEELVSNSSRQSTQESTDSDFAKNCRGSSFVSPTVPNPPPIMGMDLSTGRMPEGMPLPSQHSSGQTGAQFATPETATNVPSFRPEHLMMYQYMW